MCKKLTIDKYLYFFICLNIFLKDMYNVNQHNNHYCSRMLLLQIQIQVVTYLQHCLLLLGMIPFRLVHLKNHGPSKD
jgi:hypothetical protein